MIDGRSYGGVTGNTALEKKESLSLFVSVVKLCDARQTVMEQTGKDQEVMHLVSLPAVPFSVQLAVL